MKRRGPESRPPQDTPPDSGPFRKMEPLVDASEDAAIKKMEKEIADEGKFSIRLPENIEWGKPVPFFEDAIKNNINPKDIVFYSLATGIVKFNEVTIIRNPSSNQIQNKKFIYVGKNEPKIKLEIWLEKNKATFDSINTKEDAEKIRLNEEKRDWSYAVSNLKTSSEKIKGIIKSGKIDHDLDDLKKTTENLLQTINKKMKEKK
jgi:hypothetical protein